MTHTVRSIIFFYLFCSAAGCAECANDATVRFLDTAFLKQPTAVRAALKCEGFKRVFFRSADNLKLDAFYLERPESTCNIILCAGWLPGRKEGMATFYSLLPSTTNVLLFDARGHGRSQGPLLTNLWNYGVDEYKDVIGALAFVRQHNELPTIIIGLCAGAFHAAHALLALQHQGTLAQYHVHGSVFDSGWASVDRVSRTALPVHMCGIVRSLAGTITGRRLDRQGTQDGMATRAVIAAFQHFYRWGHRVVYAPFVRKNELQTNLFDKMARLQVPVLFIHASDDAYVAFEDVRRLYKATPFADAWWITEPSKHACHHLKHTEAYGVHLQEFLERCTSVPDESEER